MWNTNRDIGTMGRAEKRKKMEKSDRLNALSAALFFGALWGMAEATAGHALHVLRIPGLAGFLMFPLGYLFMSRAFARSGRLASIFLTSWVAASIKLVDVFMPGTDVMAVWNPVQAILLEGLAAAGLLHFMAKRRSWIPAAKHPAKLAAAGSFLAACPVPAALSWRLAYFALSLFWGWLFHAPNILRTGSPSLFRFIIIDSLANGALILILNWAFPASYPSGVHYKTDRPRLIQAVSFACLAAALCLEAIL